jgi:hypothetical protein
MPRYIGYMLQQASLDVSHISSLPRCSHISNLPRRCHISNLRHRRMPLVCCMRGEAQPRLMEGRGGGSVVYWSRCCSSYSSIYLVRDTRTLTPLSRVAL